jgi:hypothetical protein
MLMKRKGVIRNEGGEGKSHESEGGLEKLD